MKYDELQKNVTATATDVGFRVLGAILIWLVGRWLIGLITRVISAGLVRQKMDATVQRYTLACVTGLLNIVLVISILGQFGVQTTSFAAVIAAMGFAIGTAWSGLLAHFAAGVFILLLKPFKVGDLIEAGDTLGTVVEIGPFVTKVNTLDNVLTMIGNNKIFSGNIQNFSANAYRRVDLTHMFSHNVNPQEVMEQLKARVAAIPNVLKTPAPDIEILEFSVSGVVMVVRPYCNNADYWQVYFDTNRVISEFSSEKGYGAPEQHLAIRNMA